MALTTTAITTTIVKQAIGVGSFNVGTLCKSTNINRWSKYKPVRYADVDPVRGTGAVWWKANDGNCGLNIPNYPSMAAMFTALRNNVTMWDYLQPSGGSSQPFRIYDFGGYEHSAKPPLVPMVLNPKYYASLGNLGASLDLRVQSAYELAIGDIGVTYNLGSMYYGVAICKQGTAGYKYMTQTVNIATSQGGAIDVPISSELGKYEVVYFLASNPKALLSDPDKVNAFIPVPNAMQIVDIQSTPISVTVSGTFALQTAKYSIIIYNGYGVQMSINGCNIAFRYGDKAPSETLVMGEKTKSLGNVVVPANSSITLTGTIAAVGTEYATRGGYLYFTNGTNTLYNKRGEFGA